MSEFSALDENTWHPSNEAADIASGWHPSQDPEDLVFDSRTGKTTSDILGKFKYHDVPDKAASNAADKHVYRKIVICETKVRAANPEDISGHKVRGKNAQFWIQRFPSAWKEFQGEDVAIDGTPVIEVEGITADIAQVLAYDGIRTAEDLATLTDEQCQLKGLGWKTRRDAAIKLVGTKAPTEEKNSGEIESLKAQLAQMQTFIADNMATKTTAPAPEPVSTAPDADTPKPRRGRPPLRKTHSFDPSGLYSAKLA